MRTAFYYQVYFKNDPHIYIVLVGLDEFGNGIEKAIEKIMKRYGTKDFRIERASLGSILEQIVFVENIAELKVIN